MKIARMKPYDNPDSKTKAFFDLETEEGMTFKGFKLVEGSNGLFVSFPSEKGRDGKWYDSVYMPREIKDKLTDIALNEYNSQTGNTSNSNDDEDVPF